MNTEPMADPSGAYNVDEVTLTANGVPIIKGEGATGPFLHIERDGTHFQTATGSDGQSARSTVHDPQRPMAITLLRSSPGNAVFRDIRRTGDDALLRVERRQDGAVLLEAQVHMVNDGSPRDIGRDELRWDLTVVGRPTRG
jgi:hypothetical protein